MSEQAANADELRARKKAVLMASAEKTGKREGYLMPTLMAVLIVGALALSFGARQTWPSDIAPEKLSEARP